MKHQQSLLFAVLTVGTLTSQAELEKEQAINTQKDKEIECLKEIIGLLKKPE